MFSVWDGNGYKDSVVKRSSVMDKGFIAFRSKVYSILCLQLSYIHDDKKGLELKTSVFYKKVNCRLDLLILLIHFD